MFDEAEVTIAFNRETDGELGIDDPVVLFDEQQQLQHNIQGAASRNSGDARSSRNPKPANMPIT